MEPKCLAYKQNYMLGRQLSLYITLNTHSPQQNIVVEANAVGVLFFRWVCEAGKSCANTGPKKTIEVSGFFNTW